MTDETALIGTLFFLAVVTLQKVAKEKLGRDLGYFNIGSVLLLSELVRIGMLGVMNVVNGRFVASVPDYTGYVYTTTM